MVEEMSDLRWEDSTDLKAQVDWTLFYAFRNGPYSIIFKAIISENKG